MPDIRISELPLATGPTAPVGTDVVAIDNGSTRKATLSSLAPVIRPFASQAEAEAGTDNTKTMTPLTTAQAMAAVSATVAQGAKADTAMQPTIYDPSGVAGDVYDTANWNVSVVRFGASPSKTAAQNLAAFQAAEAALDYIYVPDGVFLLTSPYDLNLNKSYYGRGVLQFATADHRRRGGSSGDPGVNERYTVAYDYTNQSDVQLLFNGVQQDILSWVTPYTFEASGDSLGQLVVVRVLNGQLRLGPVPQQIAARNSIGSSKNIPFTPQTATTSSAGGENTLYGARAGLGVTNSNNTAFGSQALMTGPGGNQTAVGYQALYRSTAGGNTAVGSVAMEWNVTGEFNTSIGFGAGAHNVTGNNNVNLGYYAGSDNQGGSHNVNLGYRAAANAGSSNVASSVMIGAFSGDFAKGDSNIGIGYRAHNAESAATALGTLNIAIGREAMRYVNDGSNNVGVGYQVFNLLTNGVNNTAVGNLALSSMVTQGNATAVGYGALQNNTAASNVAVGYNALNANTTGADNVAMGREALSVNVTGANNAAFGHLAMSAGTGGNNSAFGYRSLQAGTGSRNTGVGFEAGRIGTTAYTDVTVIGHRAGRVTTGSENTALGSDALLNNTTGIQNTAIGRLAGAVDQAGTNQTAYDNTTTVGYNARVSGSNQVQLGNSSTTTYVYGTVQNRSDARDKADIRDTELGLDFIMSLRPVDYRWDMREDYISFNEDTGKVKRKKKDGSKKRTRFHHGFIAQELAECGFDFGGLQDHSKAGGADVMTVGYDEMIAPLVKAVQELTKRIKELEGK